MSEPPRWRDDALNVVRGMLMGGADVVPGVSGGTVALIVGVYHRLVTAISRCDRQLLSLLRACRWRPAAQYVDLRFLAALGVGIGLGIVAFGGVIHRLLTNLDTRPLTLAAFFGAILASTWLVGRLAGFGRSPPERAPRRLALLVAGAAFAYWFTGLPLAAGEPSLGYLFVCGTVAICAMILPGISGAYVLLVLGAYLYLTDILKRLLHGAVALDDLVVVAVFGAGCLLGLLSFSKLLKWLLARWQAPTMAVLCGFMLGALRRIWPFQLEVTPPETPDKLREYVNYLPMPSEFSGHTVGVIVVGVAAFVVVMLIDRLFQSPSAGATGEEPPAPS